MTFKGLSSVKKETFHFQSNILKQQWKRKFIWTNNFFLSQFFHISSLSHFQFLLRWDKPSLWADLQRRLRVKKFKLKIYAFFSFSPILSLVRFVRLPVLPGQPDAADAARPARGQLCTLSIFWRNTLMMVKTFHFLKLMNFCEETFAGNFSKFSAIFFLLSNFNVWPQK